MSDCVTQLRKARRQVLRDKGHPRGKQLGKRERRILEKQRIRYQLEQLGLREPEPELSNAELARQFLAGEGASPDARYRNILSALYARANGAMVPVPLLRRARMKAAA